MQKLQIVDHVIKMDFKCQKIPHGSRVTLTLILIRFMISYIALLGQRPGDIFNSEVSHFFMKLFILCNSFLGLKRVST